MEKKYAAIEFSSEEVSAWRQFLSAMAGLQIIGLTKEQVDDEVKIFMQEKVGVNTRLVLHNKKEVTDFECVMKVFFPEKEYRITDQPEDKMFEKWLKDKENRILEGSL